MKTKILTKALSLLIALFVFGLPLFFAPFLLDGYSLGKEIFVLGFSFTAFILTAVLAIWQKKLLLKKGPFFSGLLGLTAAFLASALISPKNKVLSLTAAVGPASLFILLITTALIENFGRIKLVLYSLLASGVVLSAITLTLSFGNFTFPITINSLNLSLNKAWSPTGTLVGQLIFFLAVVPLGFGLIYEEIKEKRLLAAGIIFLANTFILTGAGISLYLLSSVAKPVSLPQSAGWAIALETLKTGRFAIFGLGPGQFINAFTTGKPLTFNNNEYWNLRFASSSNWYFQLLTEVGFLGLGIYLLLVWKILKKALGQLRQPKPSPVPLALHLSLVLIVLAQAFCPMNFFLLAVLFILLGTASVESGEKKESDLTPLGNLVFLLLAVPLSFWTGLLFFSTKIALADSYFLNSIKAANRNDGVKTYDLQIKTIKTNPSSPVYRIAYAQTNLALANSLAGKKDLTDQDRSTITQLVQQSIREAKSAVALDPASADAWENLATIYRSLINLAADADKWALASYQEAIRLDPFNPRLRIDLGGLFYTQKNWVQAASVFNQAATLKPDFANAHYNLANALREAGDLVASKKEYEITQTLVKVDSNDYQKVTSELEDVKRRIPAPTPTEKPGTPETLSTPTTPPATLKPKLELPNEGPPVSPSPTPTTKPAETKTPEVSPTQLKD